MTQANATLAAAAKNWRMQVARLTLPQLARRTGYSVAAICIFERGCDYSGRPVKPSGWKTYAMACAAVHWGAHEFDFVRVGTRPPDAAPAA